MPGCGLGLPVEEGELEPACEPDGAGDIGPLVWLPLDGCSCLFVMMRPLLLALPGPRDCGRSGIGSQKQIATFIEPFPCEHAHMPGTAVTPRIGLDADAVPSNRKCGLAQQDEQQRWPCVGAVGLGVAWLLHLISCRGHARVTERRGFKSQHSLLQLRGKDIALERYGCAAWWQAAQTRVKRGFSVASHERHYWQERRAPHP